MFPSRDLRKLITIKAGETFSRAKMAETTKKLSERLGEGMAMRSPISIRFPRSTTKPTKSP